MIQQSQNKNLKQDNSIVYKTIHTSSEFGKIIECMAIDKDENILVIGTGTYLYCWDISDKTQPQVKQQIQISQKGSVGIICFSKKSQWFVCCIQNEIQMFNQENNFWTLVNKLTDRWNLIDEMVLSQCENELIWKRQNGPINIAGKQGKVWNLMYQLKQSVGFRHLSLNDTQLATSNNGKINIFGKDSKNKWRKQQCCQVNFSILSLCFMKDNLIVIARTNRGYEVVSFSNHRGLIQLQQVIELHAQKNIYRSPKINFNLQVIYNQTGLFINSFLRITFILKLQESGQLEMCGNNFIHELEGIFTPNGQYFFGSRISPQKYFQILKLI